MGVVCVEVQGVWMAMAHIESHVQFAQTILYIFISHIYISLHMFAILQVIC